MMNRLRVAATLVTELVTATALLSIPATASAAVGLCGLASHDYYEVFVHKQINEVSGNWFDEVRGDAYARDLDVCIGGTGGNGGTFVDVANVQEQSSGPHIFQVGYGKMATDSAIKFIYANSSSTLIQLSSPSPSIAHRYRFDIKRDTSGHPDFLLTDLTVGTLIWSNTTTGTSWGGGFDLDWWGFETWDSFSHHGPNLPGSGVNMAYLGYSTDLNTVITYRSGMTVGGDVCKCSGNWAQVDGNHQTVLTIGNWVYGGDKFDSEVQP
jgi:hypothetical protein